jgi:putative membrane protein
VTAPPEDTGRPPDAAGLPAYPSAPGRTESAPGRAPSAPGVPGPGVPGAGVPGDISSWHRLHPLSPLVRSGRHLVTLFTVIVVLLFVNRSQARGDIITDVVVVVVAMAAGVVSWLVTRWQVADGVLRIDTGLVRRDSRRFPLSQVQAIDVVQTGIARVLGLAELRLRMAGADSSGGRLACLPLAEAEQLRGRLLAMASRAAASGAAAAMPVAPGAPGVTSGPERPLFRVKSERLAGAVALSRPGAYAGTVIAAVILIIVFTGDPGIITPFVFFAFGVVVAGWRQCNGEFGTVVPDGLRLRSGLIQTTAETIRPGRVQAVRLVEPLCWRAFGWCRLEVDVAGSRQRRENRSEGQRLRALIPVGSLAEAQQMLGELIGTPPQPTRRAPANTRWKAPLTNHFLGWGEDDRYVVAARGRVCRKTTWVPLEKVQSIRWVQGPLQRRLGLASIKLDVAGRRVTASIQDRGEAEALEILGRLPDLARAARAAGPAGWGGASRGDAGGAALRGDAGGGAARGDPGFTARRG